MRASGLRRNAVPGKKLRVSLATANGSIFLNLKKIPIAHFKGFVALGIFCQFRRIFDHNGSEADIEELAQTIPSSN